MVSISERYLFICLSLSLLLIDAQALRSFTGGSNVFFSVIGTSIITSYTSISRTLKFEPPAADIADSLSRVLGSTWPSLEALFEDFLTTIGVPFNPLWEDAKLHFSPKIDLADIDSPAFRPRALFWAATGTPFVDVTGDKLAVSLYRVTIFCYLTIFRSRSQILPMQCTIPTAVWLQGMPGMASCLFALASDMFDCP